MNKNGKYSILIFEDDIDLATQWKHYFKEQGCDVEHVWDIQEAMNLCNQKKFDCIICDLLIYEKNGNLKPKGGITLLHYLKTPLLNRLPDWVCETPVIVVTGASFIQQVHLLDLGVTTVLKKPLTIEKLEAEVFKIMNRS